MTTWEIDTQKDMKGIVKQEGNNLLWKITSPFVGTCYYGNSTMTPCTWLDKNKKEQFGVMKNGEWCNGKCDIALNSENNPDGSPGYAEIYVSKKECTILPVSSGKTTRIRFPKCSHLGFISSIICKTNAPLEILYPDY